MSDNVLHFGFDRSKWTLEDVQQLTDYSKLTMWTFIKNYNKGVSLNCNGWAKLVGISVENLKDCISELFEKGFLIENSNVDVKEIKKGLTSRGDKLDQLNVSQNTLTPQV